MASESKVRSQAISGTIRSATTGSGTVGHSVGLLHGVHPQSCLTLSAADTGAIPEWRKLRGNQRDSAPWTCTALLSLSALRPCHGPAMEELQHGHSAEGGYWSVLKCEYPDVAAEDDSLHGRLCDPHNEFLKATKWPSPRLQDLSGCPGTRSRADSGTGDTAAVWRSPTRADGLTMG